LSLGIGRLACYIDPDMMQAKPLRWVGNSRDAIRRFPADARRRAGFELWELQEGRAPSDWRPMPTVGLGVNEIRIYAGGAYRVLYIAKFSEAIYVLHAFAKTTRRTSKPDLDLACARLRGVMAERKTHQW
jgi:phage-related protein